jgi:hypothetical protein
MAQPCLLAHPDEGMREAIRLDRRSDLSREHQPVITPEAACGDTGLGLAGVMLAKDGYQLGSQR